MSRRPPARPPLTGIALALMLAGGAGACSESSPVAPDPVIEMAAVPATSGQQALAGAPLPVPLAVRVTIDGAPAPDIEVEWTASQGTLGRTRSRTDATGLTTSAWTLGTAIGEQTATATLVSPPRSQVSFSARALDPTPAPRPRLIAVGIAQGPVVTLYHGASLPLQAEAYYDDGTVAPAPDPVWSVTDASIATISADGWLSPGEPGTTIVTLASSGLTAAAGVLVVGPIASLEIVPVPSTIFVGQRAYWTMEGFDAHGTPVDVPEGVTVVSSAPDVAAAQTDGTALGVAPGTAEFTATVDGASGSATLTVVPMPDLGGRWQIMEQRELNTYPALYCSAGGSLDLVTAAAPGPLTGTYALTGTCPTAGGGEVDLTETLSVTGSTYLAAIEFQTVSNFRCTYLGTLRPGNEIISGGFTCEGMPGTPVAGEWHDGSFTMRR